MGLLQLGQLFGAVGFVAEEQFLGDCEELDPMLMVGFEGLAGFILWLILLPIFNVVKCTNEELCDEKNGVIESSIAAFKSFGFNSLLIWQSVIVITNVCIHYVAGVSITKYGSAA